MSRHALDKDSTRSLAESVNRFVVNLIFRERCLVTQPCRTLATDTAGRVVGIERTVSDLAIGTAEVKGFLHVFGAI